MLSFNEAFVSHLREAKKFLEPYFLRYDKRNALRLSANEKVVLTLPRKFCLLHIVQLKRRREEKARARVVLEPSSRLSAPVEVCWHNFIVAIFTHVVRR